MEIGQIMSLVTRMVSMSSHLPFLNEPRITSGEYIIFHLWSVSWRFFICEKKNCCLENSRNFFASFRHRGKGRRARSVSLRSSPCTRYKDTDTDTDTRREREKFLEFSISSRVHWVSCARVFHVLVYFTCSCISRARAFRVLVYFARLFGCRGNYSQSNKEMAYVTREGYAQEELLTELIVPGFLNHTIHVDMNFLLFYPSLLLLLSIMASCVEVIDLCLLTLFWGLFCDAVMALVSCNIALDKHLCRIKLH